MANCPPRDLSLGAPVANEAKEWGVSRQGSLASEVQALSSSLPSAHRKSCEECPLWGAFILKVKTERLFGRSLCFCQFLLEQLENTSTLAALRTSIARECLTRIPGGNIKRTCPDVVRTEPVGWFGIV
jgi:hypothetical protein